MPTDKEVKKEVTAVRFDPDKLKKAKYMAWFDRETFTDVVNTALDVSISKFEKKNGVITEAQISQSLKKK